MNHVAELLVKRSEGFIRAEIMDQGRAIHGVSKEDNDITREVYNIKHFTSQTVATMESATRIKGKISIIEFSLSEVERRVYFSHLPTPIESLSKGVFTL